MTKPQLQSATLGRNDLCSCGSQKKFKKCCGIVPVQCSAPVPTSEADVSALLWGMALRAFETGNLSLSLANCEKLITANPRHAEALHLRAMISYRQSEYSTALQYVQHAIAAAPRQSGFYNSLGLIHRELGQVDEAETAYRKALILDPNNAMAHNNLGDLWHNPETFADAEKCYQDALRCQPNFPEAHNNLGLLCIKMQQYDLAIEHFVKAIQSRPSYLNAYYSLSTVLRRQARYSEAQSVLQQALSIKPDYVEAWHDLGVTLLALQKPDSALEHFEKAVQLQPDFYPSYLNIGNIYYERGEVELALQCFQQAQEVQPFDALEIKMALCVPAVYDSQAQLDAERERLTNDLDRLMTTNLRINNPYEEIGLTPFFLGYHGENEVEMLSRIGDLFLKSCPQLGAVAAHCQTPKKENSPLNIGFISSNFHREHIVNRVMAGVIANWPRADFRVTLLHLHSPCGEIMRTLRDGDRLVQVPGSLRAAQQKIADAKLDILFYCDLGMEPWTYFLSFARLAPIQLTSGGHPITSGVPTVDYFVSSSIDELPHAQEHYREKLIVLPERPVCYYPHTPIAQQKTRSDFGLSDNQRVYLCPMTPYKLHPEMDQLFGEILRADTGGEIVFVENFQTNLWERLKQRLVRTLPDVFARMRFLNYLPMADFVELVRLADVVLDTTKFNGGTTSLETFAVGTPMVTLPGEFLRQRGTYALYNCMEMYDCIAKDAADYVRLATEIAQNPEYREQLKQKILARNSVLYEQKDWINPLSNYLREALRKA